MSPRMRRAALADAAAGHFPELGTWAPPGGPDIEMQSAGETWDAVKAPAHLADRALVQLGDASGAVIRDPWSNHLYWFVHPGLAGGWDLPHVTVLGTACYVAVPPAACTRSLGPHWAVPPTAQRLLTDPGALHAALADAVAAVLGPRPGVVR